MNKIYVFDYEQLFYIRFTISTRDKKKPVLKKISLAHRALAELKGFAETMLIIRQTAAKYLEKLVPIKLLSLHKIGKENYYINDALYTFLYNAPDLLPCTKSKND